MHRFENTSFSIRSNTVRHTISEVAMSEREMESMFSVEVSGF